MIKSTEWDVLPTLTANDLYTGQCCFVIVQSLRRVWLCNPMTVACQPPPSRDFPSRILEWVAISSSRRSSPTRYWAHVFCTAKWILITKSPGRPWWSHAGQWHRADCSKKQGGVWCVIRAWGNSLYQVLTMRAPRIATTQWFTELFQFMLLNCWLYC